MHLKKLQVIISVLVISSISLAGCSHSSKISQNRINRVIDVAEKQYTRMLEVSTDLTKYPRTSNPDGSVKYVSIRDWTGGFWPGSIWYLYDFTKKDAWEKLR